MSFHGFSFSRGQTTRVAASVLQRHTLFASANICWRSRGEFATGRAAVFPFLLNAYFGTGVGGGAGGEHVGCRAVEGDLISLFLVWGTISV